MKKIFILIFLFSISVQAQQSGLIVNVEGRKTIGLNGQWKAIVDQYDTGLHHYNIFKDTKPKNKSEFVEYGFDTSDSLNVPGDWNPQKEQLFFYEGTIWYKKSFDYQRKDKTRLFVYFGAANYLADVYLNRKKVGTHEGGFTPFNFEITDMVQDKDNFLIVRVNNRRYRDMQKQSAKREK